MSATKVENSDWMVWLQIGGNEFGVTWIYDPSNGIDEDLKRADVTDALGQDRGAELLVIRGDRRPAMWVGDEGDLAMWTQPGSSWSMDEQAMGIDDMDGLGFDSAEDVATLWSRARLFVDALNVADGAS